MVVARQTLESHSRPAWSPHLVYLPELSVLGCEISPGAVLRIEVTYSFAHLFIQSFAACFLESRLCLKLRSVSGLGALRS